MNVKLIIGVATVAVAAIGKIAETIENNKNSNKQA